MSGSYSFVWIPLLVFCVFHTSDNQHVFQAVEGNSQLDRIMSKIPIILPEGIDPKNINITSVTIKTCTGMKEELMLLNKQLQQTTLRNTQLDNEAFGLRSEVRLLKIQLTTCSSAASAITDSYQIQLRNKMKLLLETFDSDEFLILKTIALTREVNALETKVKHAANSTETTTESRELQEKLQEKTNDLNEKIQQIQRRYPDVSLILQIISLQNQIWDLEQAMSSRGETGVQADKRIQALQDQLDRLISQLRSKGDAKVLQLISVHSKITLMQKLIRDHIEDSRAKATDFQRQRKKTADLLKRKVLQLNRDESNTELTREILKLQAELEQFQLLMLNAKSSTDSQLKDLKVNLEVEKKEQDDLQRQLEEADYAQAQLIMKIISMMKDMRELQVDEQDQTLTSQANTLQILLQAKEREFARAQAEINELQRKLKSKSEKCSGLEEHYERVKTEFEQKIAELNRTGDSNVALILNVINLHAELKTLQEQISTTHNPDRISELQTQLTEKQDELKSKTADIERLTANHRTILTIIEQLNEISDLQRKAANETTSDRLKQLQNKVDGLITEIDDEEITKLTLKIVTLQSQVGQLRQLQTDQMTLSELSNDLTMMEKELEKYVNELMEKNQTNARLILTVTNLQKQLRSLENERRDADTASASTITQLREQLKAKMEEHSRDQDRMRALQALFQNKEREHAIAQAKLRELQRTLQSKSKDCLGVEERHEQIKTEFEQAIAKLNRIGDSKVALILNVMNLHDELRSLREQISTTHDTNRISELQKQLEAKQEDLNSKTADIERLIPNPKIILTIIELQDEMWDLEKQAANETNYELVKELQGRVNGLITEIDDDEKIKLMLKIIMLQSQVEQLQKQSALHTDQPTKLKDSLATKLKELKGYTNELSASNHSLILTVTQLHSKLRKLEMEKHDKDKITSATITNLREQLKTKVEEQTRDQAEIKALQIQLNQTEMQCSGFEQKLKDLQNDLDSKMKELQSKSDTITSLALQVSTLTLQLEELKQQLQNTESETKMKELQKIIDEKTNELAKKTEELKERSAQPQRLLQIIAIQTEIEKISNVAANDTDYLTIRALQNQLDYLIDGIQDEKDENTKLMFKILAQQDEIARLKKQEETQTQGNLQKIKDLESELEDIRNQIQKKTLLLDSSDRRITNLSAQIMELQKKIKPLEDMISYLKEENTENLEELQNRLNLSKRQLQDSELRLKEADAKNFNSIMEIADLRAKLKQAQKVASRAAKQNINELEQQIQTQQKENQKLENVNKDLREQLKTKVEEQTHDQAEIKALQIQLNQTEMQCSGYEQKLKDLQNDLDSKMKELQSKSDTVTSLALQVSTLTLQLEELKRQLQNTVSETKMKELQKIIDEKTNELAKKTEELKERSAQPQRFLQIIAIQTEIEKIVNVAANDTDYMTIRALQNQLDYLIDGIQDEKDEKDENTKLMFKILAQQDELARLKKQEETQTQGNLQKIKDLESELEDIRNQIQKKTLLLDSSDRRIANMSAQIMELHKKIKPLEDAIAYLKEKNTENLEELQNRLNLSKRQLQDNELRLKEADAKNFNSIMEIADLRAKLKQAQKVASRAAKQNINELEQQIQTQQKENQKLENVNKDLRQEVKELQMCCSDANTHCDDLQRQLQQSQEDADRLQQQLNRKDALFKQLQQDLGEQRRENNRLKDDNSKVQNEKNKLENAVQDLQNKLNDVEDKTVHASKMTFDANTAHPRIALSADETEMSTREETQNVEDHPERFNIHLAVLGKTGFSSGRHYWEVSVAGKLCYHIGMASGSAPRRGTVMFSPANGFWTIVLNKQGQYRAVDRRSVDISVQSQPVALGILLDYKKGQISFYDAGARSHMYTFVGQRFTDKIYPFVNFCVEEAENQTPIMFLTPGSVDWIK